LRGPLAPPEWRAPALHGTRGRNDNETDGTDLGRRRDRRGRGGRSVFLPPLPKYPGSQDVAVPAERRPTRSQGTARRRQGRERVEGEDACHARDRAEGDAPGRARDRAEGEDACRARGEGERVAGARGHGP